MTELERLQHELDYLRAEKVTENIQSLISEFSLPLLFDSLKLSRSTYYHQVKHLSSEDTDAELKAVIQRIDNGMMKSFFGILKSEMFYDYAKAFQSIDELKVAISTTTSNESKLNEKDCVLSNTERNPLFKISCPTFWGQIKRQNRAGGFII